MDRRRGCRIESPQQPMQGGPSGARTQPLTQPFVPRRCRRQPIEQRPKIESCPAGHKREPAPVANPLECRTCRPRVISRRRRFVRFKQIQTMVRDSGTIVGRRLCRPYIHAPVHRDRVAGHHFSPKLFGKIQGEARLTASGWAGNHDQSGLLFQVRQNRASDCAGRPVYHCRHHPA
jgi:hypothetical protein